MFVLNANFLPRNQKFNILRRNENSTHDISSENNFSLVNGKKKVQKFKTLFRSETVKS